MGSGPATHVASVRRPGGLVLMAPFTSFREAARGIFGSVLQYCASDSFCNKEELRTVTSPTLLLHGLKDAVIPYTHSQELSSAATATSCMLYCSKSMNHCTFDLMQDLVAPCCVFLNAHGISTLSKDPQACLVPLPCELFALPPMVKCN